MLLQKSKHLTTTSGSFLETAEKTHRGVSNSVGKSLQNLASLESAVNNAHAAIEELNNHATGEQIMTFTSKGGNTRRQSMIFQLPKEGKVYVPIVSFATHAKSFPFLGDKVERASDGSVILVNSELSVGLSLDSGYMPQFGFFNEVTVVSEDFVNSEKVQKAFKSTLWQIAKMTGEPSMPAGYVFDYGAY